jgi:peptide/nickel transport system permease protein
MTPYLVRRIGQAILVVFGVMFVTFILAHLEPGSAARATLGLKATPARVALFDQVYGLNKPLPVQFFQYILNALHGDLGTSYSLQQPVSSLIAQRLPLDVLLLGTSTVLALLLALPIGIYQALHHNEPIDDVLGGTWFTLYSAPDFMLALLLIALLCVRLHVLPPAFPGGVTSVTGVLGEPKALVLPVIVLGINSVAGFSQYTRSSAIEQLGEGYIRLARAKGLPERLVVSGHLLRNSLLPIVTIVGMSLPAIVAGAVIAESIFNFPGMGQLFWQAALSHDFPILLGVTLVISIATVTGNLAADMVYGVLDPRIRYGRS